MVWRLSDCQAEQPDFEPCLTTSALARRPGRVCVASILHDLLTSHAETPRLTQRGVSASSAPPYCALVASTATHGSDGTRGPAAAGSEPTAAVESWTSHSA